MQLLLKDPSKRLGSNGASEVQEHPLFKSIDWKRLEAGKMKPLFEPDVCVTNLCLIAPVFFCSNIFIYFSKDMAVHFVFIRKYTHTTV